MLEVCSTSERATSERERERERDEVEGYSYRDMIWVFYANCYS